MRFKTGYWTTIGTAALLSVAYAGAVEAQSIEKAVPIKIVVNQSPWYKGFERLVEHYEKVSGNKVTLDVNPMPATQEKQRNSVRAPSGDFDMLPINSQILPEMYKSGLLQPITDIDPSFKLNPNIPTFSETACWDEARQTYDCKTGKLMGVPINGNVQLLYYRSDLYKEKGLSVPKTLDELRKNVIALHSMPAIAGIAHQGNRGAPDATWSFMPFLHAYGASFFKDPDKGDFTVTLNSAEGLKAFEYWIETGTKYGPDSPGTVSQGRLLQLLTTGKVAHAVVVVAAWAQMDDPQRSVVAGKIDFAPVPAGPVKQSTTLGHFIGGIPKNISQDRKKAAVTFLKWFQGREAQEKMIEFEGLPVAIDVLKDYAPKDPKYRWADALAKSFDHTDMFFHAEGAAIVPITDLRFNQAVIGELTPKAALNMAAKEVAELMAQKGYKTGRLPDLN